MNKLAAVLMAAALVTGCADNKVIPGHGEVKTYGVIDEGSIKNPCIDYELSVGNVIWSVILIETVAMPIYFIGFSMYEPVDAKPEC